VLVSLVPATGPSIALAQAKPDIIFMMGDDIGMRNISAHGVVSGLGRFPTFVAAAGH
jgi:hypothetical protein